jgi:hypothetical protein
MVKLRAFRHAPSLFALALLSLPAFAALSSCGAENSTETATGSGSAQAGSGGTGTGSASGSPTTGTATTSSASGTGGSSSGVVRLIAIGDTGEGNPEQHQVADRMNEKCQMVGGCDAVLVNGDNFYDNGVTGIDDPQWATKFEEPYDRPNLNGLPFYVVLGNHDAGPTSTGNKQAQIDYTFLPVGNGPGMRLSDKWQMPAAYYDVRIKHVHLFAFDSIDFSNAQQENELSMKVAASTATWKMAFAHFPRYTSGEHYYDNMLLGGLGLFNMQKAIYCGTDIYMSGHDHNREFIDKGRDSECPNTYFIVSGAGAKTREGSQVMMDPSQLYYEDLDEGYAYMEFNNNTLLFQFIDKNGVVNFEKTITK